MVAASLLSDAEFGPNHHRKEIAHFINSPFQPEFRATLLGPIGIGLCLGYSSGAIESIKDDPNIDPTTNQKNYHILDRFLIDFLLIWDPTWPQNGTAPVFAMCTKILQKIFAHPYEKKNTPLFSLFASGLSPGS